MQVYKFASLVGVLGLSMFTLVGCGNSTNNVYVSSPLQTMSTKTQGTSVTKFSSGPPSRSWIQGTVTKTSSNVTAGTIFNISGQLSRVSRYPNIQVSLYQSKGSNYQANAVQLVRKNLPVLASAMFSGTITVPTFYKSAGSYFTLVFKYKGFLQPFSLSIQK